jgi:hypothetical protein
LSMRVFLKVFFRKINVCKDIVKNYINKHIFSVKHG